MADKQEFWRDSIITWINFYEKKFGIVPTFRPIDAKKLMSIVNNLKKRTIDGGGSWDEQTAIASLNKFLELAWDKDKWLRDNFTLSILESRFDVILTHGRKKHNQTKGGDFDKFWGK